MPLDGWAEDESRSSEGLRHHSEAPRLLEEAAAIPHRYVE